jgi:hypothetical protein
MMTAIFKKFASLLMSVYLMLGMVFGAPATCRAETVSLPIGTRIPVSVYNTVSSNNLHDGDMVSAVIRNDVTYNGVVFFRKGDSATLTVDKSKPASGHGGAGLLNITGGRAVDAKGQDTPFGLSLQMKGHSKRGWGVTATVLGILVILIPFGIWVEGTPATIQGGAVYEGLTTAPIQFSTP